MKDIIVSQEDDLLKSLNQSGKSTNTLDWSDDQYFKDTRYVTNTHLSKINEGGPLHLLKHFNEPQEPKDHHIWGSAFHCLILEPDQFNKRFYVLDESEILAEVGGERPRATKKYKEWFQQITETNAGKQALNAEDYQNMLNIQERVQNFSQSRELLKYGLKEKIFYSTLEDIEVKAKVDLVNVTNYACELKSIKEPPTPYMFSKLLRDYSWNRQCAFYYDILKVPSFFFIVCEKEAPYNIGVYEISESVIKQGRENYIAALKQYKMYFKNEKFSPKDFYYFGVI